MFDYAPGPWKTDPEVGNEAVLDANGVMVADCSIFLNPSFGRRDSDTNTELARYIAALPDIVSALRSIAEYPNYALRPVALARETLAKLDAR